MWLVMVKGEESLEEEQCQESESHPVDRCDRSHPDRLRHHVKKAAPNIVPGRKAQVDL